MRQIDFFEESTSRDLGLPIRSLNTDLIADIVSGKTEHADIDVAVPLAHLIHDEFESCGTHGNTSLSNDEVRSVLQALSAVLRRIGVEFDLPFRDFDRFRSYGKRNGAVGSWQARRDILAPIFEPLHDQLADLQAAALTSELASAATAHPRTGWPRVEEEVIELRRHFQAARTPQDYRNIGNDCVIVLERLSEVAYVPDRHLAPGEVEPPVGNTKARLERVVEVELKGRSNAELRKLTRAAIEQAQAVKHSTPDRQRAAIAANSTILIASIFRHLVDPEY